MALQDKKIMPPPWLAHREIERYSIGWRMGYGEDYIYRFGDWLDILPEPKEDWEAYLWLAGSIGDAYFMMRNYGKSLGFFRKCCNIGETDNPFILLRLGENYLELEDETNATEFLLRAYMLEGNKIFKEDWKYFQWLSKHVNLKRK